MPGVKLDTPAKRAIKAKGYEFEYLANRLGISRSYFSHILAGTYPMKRERAQRLADILGLDINIFIDIKKDDAAEDAE